MTVTRFDDQFYLSQRPDVGIAIANGAFAGTAEDHYNQYGWCELSNPNVEFNTSYYLAANPDVLAARVNPFQHYVEYGINEGRGPSSVGEFDSYFYFSQRPDVLRAIINGLYNGSGQDHYNSSGWREGSDPNTHFDTSYYLNNNADVAAAGINPFQHYVEYGIGEGRSGSVDGQPGGGGPGEPYDLSNTAANLAALDPNVLNGAVNITATDAATVAQAQIIAAATNTGTTTYAISDLFGTVATANADLLRDASSVTANGTDGSDVIGLGTLTVNLGINGLDGNDTITGGQGNDTIDGGAGFDWINGSAGNDTLTGGLNGDTLVGSAGADTINLANGGGDAVEYNADADAGTAGQLAQNQGDTVTGFTSAAGDAAEVDDIRLIGTFLTGAMTGTSANAVTAVGHGAGINFAGAGTGTNSVFLVAPGTNTGAIGDLFTLGDLNSAIGSLTGESAGAERILAFNSSDGNAVLYKYTSSVTPDSVLTADELQVLGTFDENLAVGDFIFA